MVKKRTWISKAVEITAVLLTVATHWIIFYFLIINSMKSNTEASKLSLALPTDFQWWDNIVYVVTYRDNAIFRAFFTSFTVTFWTLLIIVIVASMAAFILSRRKSSRICRASNKLIVACMTVPASVIPTYYMLSILHVANTLTGLVLVEVAALFPFCTMMYKGFVSTIPREIDEAAVLDGCGPLQLFWRIIFPILKPVSASIVILRSIKVFNDFQNAQYYLFGSKSMTIQLCVYIFKSAFATKWAYLFTASILASMPLLILYVFLNKQILKGMTTGAVKG